jgi:hypothetical protein
MPDLGGSPHHAVIRWRFKLMLTSYAFGWVETGEIDQEGEGA